MRTYCEWFADCAEPGVRSCIRSGSRRFSIDRLCIIRNARAREIKLISSSGGSRAAGSRKLRLPEIRGFRENNAVSDAQYDREQT